MTDEKQLDLKNGNRIIVDEAGDIDPYQSIEGMLDESVLDSVVADAVTDGYSKQFYDYVRFGTTRPTQDSLEAAAIAVRTPGAAPRTLFKKPNRLPRKTREAIKAAQMPNKENVWMDPDKKKRDQMFDDLRASGIRPTKSSTSVNGLTAWVVSWSK